MPTGITTTVGRVPIPFAGFGSYGATLLDLPGDMRDRAAIVDQQIRALMIDVDANWQSLPRDVREARDLRPPRPAQEGRSPVQAAPASSGGVSAPSPARRLLLPRRTPFQPH